MAGCQNNQKSNIFINIYIQQISNYYTSKMIHSKQSLVILSLFIVSTLCISSFQINKVDRVVQLNAQYPSQVIKVDYKCIVQQCDVIQYLQTQYQHERVSLIAFHKEKQATQSLAYTTQNYNYNGENYILHKINLKTKIHQGETFSLVVSVVYLNRYINYPASIELSEDQKFQYEDNKNFLAPYLIKESVVNYKFNKIIGFSTDGEKKGLSGVAFKSSDVQPFSYVSHRVHGVNNQPQVYFSEVIREIQVSHWGNVAITEFYKIKNVGPDLKGEFSRVQFSSNNKFQAKNAWRGIQTTFPYQIWGLYYRDEVGNISTSRAFRDDHQEIVKANFEPRYALLGGWKANWEIGYNLNTKGILRHDQNQFELNKIAIQYAFSSILAQKYTIRLILPEGSTKTKIFIGDNAVGSTKVTKGINFGYLDFSGRPTFTVENVKGELKNKKLKVTYEIEYISIFKKPLLVFGAIFSILILLITVKRINMSAFEDDKVKKN